MENKEWFLYVVDHHEGPFSADEIKKRVKKGLAKSSSYVWKDGLEDWMLMTDVTEFGPGGAKSDGHGPFAFLTNLLPKKKKPAGEAAVAGAAAAALAAAGGQTASGPDVSDVSTSDSVWCLNSQKQFTGPHSLKNIVRKINDGDISVEDAVWKDGWTSFVRISNIPGFMEGVKPDVLSGKTPKKKKKSSSEAKATAAAMGIGGTSSRNYTWYRSRKFKIFTFSIVMLSLYQSLTIGYLDPVLEKAPDLQKTLKAKITELGLKPIPTWELNKYFDSIEETVRPYAIKALALMPEQIQTRFQILQVPDGLSPADAENIREIASADLKKGVRLASAMPVGEERTPSFYIASNGPDGLVLKVTLKGRENTLLNAVTYEKSVEVTVNKRMVAVPPFTVDANQVLPKGEYAIIVYESDKQTSPEAMAALAATPKQATPALIPAGKVAFVVDEFFLGGKRDATYDKQLKEYHDRTNVKLGAEAFELKQFSLELERMANESALKFQSLIVAPPSPQRKARWTQYHDAYVKSGAQVKVSIAAKTTPAALKDSVIPHLWTQANQTYQLTETLHQAETDAIEKGGTVTSVNAQAGQTAAAVGELKQAVSKFLK